MANIKVRRKTGSSTYEVIYPTADWSNIDSKPTTFTPTAHTHVATEISDSGNVGRNLLTTSSATASSLFFKKNPDHTIALETDSTFRTSIGAAATSHTHGNITNAGAIGSTSGLAVFTTTSGVLTTRSVTDLTALTQLGSASTNAVTERTVFYGTHMREINVSAAIASSTSFTTMTFTSGMTDFWLYIHQDTTTGAVIARLPLTITSAQSIGTASPGKTHRVAWSNGSTTQVMNVDVFYSGTTLSFRHNFAGASLAFRWFAY